MKSSIALSLALFSVLAVPALSSTTTVHIFNFDFSANPSTGPIVDPTINLGDTIHWVWDSGDHSTTSVAGLTESWNSGDHIPTFSFDHTFTHLGVFPYYCDIHGHDNHDGTAGGMSGTISVVPEPSTLWMLSFISLCAPAFFWGKVRK